MMADNKEQTVCVTFCFLLGKSAAETVLMLQEAFKEEALSIYTTAVKKISYIFRHSTGAFVREPSL
jgi:hypothetical protein